MKKRRPETVEEALRDVHRSNSDQALQASIELMLTDRPASDVIKALVSWIDYLKDNT